MKRLVKIAYWLCFAVVSCVCFAISFFYALPVTFSTEYHSVVPASEVSYVGDTLYFISTRTVHRKSDLIFNDALFCKFKHDITYHPYAYFKSERPNVQPTTNKQITMWPFDKTVDEPGACYLESNITTHHPFGVHKTQKIVGPIFQVKEREP